MKRAVSRRLAVALIAFCLPLIPNPASAQQEKGKSLSEPTEQKPLQTYRIEFNVREIEGGKRLNSRSYMMMAQDGDWGKVRVSDGVRFQADSNSTLVVSRDVGMSIDCRPREQEDSVALAIHAELTSLAPQTEATPTLPGPFLRTERTEVQSIVTLGKPTLVAGMDDVVTNRRYEIEVTATKVK